MNINNKPIHDFTLRNQRHDWMIDKTSELKLNTPKHYQYFGKGDNISTGDYIQLDYNNNNTLWKIIDIQYAQEQHTNLFITTIQYQGDLKDE